MLGDRARLRRVLDNLLGNVRSHTPADTPAHVRVSTLNGSAVLEVSDEGPGLADDDLDRVFERFYRADTSRSRESGGVGLGLSIVAAIADAHAGKVSVVARPEGGATFRVELPLASPPSLRAGVALRPALERVLDAPQRVAGAVDERVVAPGAAVDHVAAAVLRRQAVVAAAGEQRCPGPRRRRSRRRRGRPRADRCRRRR